MRAKPMISQVGTRPRVRGPPMTHACAHGGMRTDSILWGDWSRFQLACCPLQTQCSENWGCGCCNRMFVEEPCSLLLRMLWTLPQPLSAIALATARAAVFDMALQHTQIGQSLKELLCVQASQEQCLAEKWLGANTRRKSLAILVQLLNISCACICFHWAYHPRVKAANTACAAASVLPIAIALLRAEM